MTSPAEPVLTIAKLEKSFGDNLILRGVDLDVFPGDVVSIIGASGSGKTTLLRCVDLLEEFEAGEIRLDGDPLGYRVGADGRRTRLRGR
ncbi:MAG: amino acid ABC transporter ATP-binding protein, partial [Hyphomicrobiales bacterium]|nr:amino acid ABC transporter ATP-binding protein [Hyphomicrobiales bacterium]